LFLSAFFFRSFFFLLLLCFFFLIFYASFFSFLYALLWFFCFFLFFVRSFLLSLLLVHMPLPDPFFVSPSPPKFLFSFRLRSLYRCLPFLFFPSYSFSVYFSCFIASPSFLFFLLSSFLFVCFSFLRGLFVPLLLFGSFFSLIFLFLLLSAFFPSTCSFLSFPLFFPFFLRFPGRSFLFVLLSHPSSVSSCVVLFSSFFLLSLLHSSPFSFVFFCWLFSLLFGCFRLRFIHFFFSRFSLFFVSPLPSFSSSRWLGSPRFVFFVSLLVALLLFFPVFVSFACVFVVYFLFSRLFRTLCVFFFRIPFALLVLSSWCVFLRSFSLFSLFVRFVVVFVLFFFTLLYSSLVVSLLFPFLCRSQLRVWLLLSVLSFFYAFTALDSFFFRCCHPSCVRFLVSLFCFFVYFLLSPFYVRLVSL